jgi:thiol-disulfide isomerase/thioredoxin
MVGRRKWAPCGWLLLTLSCASSAPAPVTSSAPEVRLLDGRRVAWPTLLDSQGSTLVVFATLWCQICRRELPEVQAWARAHREPKRTVYVFSGGEMPGVVDQIRALKLDETALTVVVDADGHLADYYRVQSTPTLLMLTVEGRVLSTQHRFKSLDLD